MVCFTPSSLMVLPAICGSRAKRLCQRLSAIRATLVWPSLSSLRKAAADCRVHSHDFEESGGHARGRQDCGFSRAGEADGLPVHGRHALECIGMALQVDIVGIAEAARPPNGPGSGACEIR